VPASESDGVDARLAFDAINIMGEGCFAQSADYSLLTSERGCFEPTMVFTLMDAANHFALLPVSGEEWGYLQTKIPKAAPAVKPTEVAPASPCAPPVVVPAVYPRVYGHMSQNRMCVSIPELNCTNNCGKYCEATVPQSVDVPKFVQESCIVCYDCEFPEMIYAVLCTLIAFILCMTIYKCCCMGRWADASYETIYNGDHRDIANSPLLVPHKPGTTLCYACESCTFPILSLICTIIAFVIVNSLDFLITTSINEKEMCLKIFPWQHVNVGNGYWWREESWARQHPEMCVNEVCQWRLIGLMTAVWLSLWALFVWFMWGVEITQTKTETTREVCQIEYGAGTFWAFSRN
jgi:hypothetical protein